MDLFESWLVTTPICKHGLTSDNAPEYSKTAITNAIKNNYAILVSVQSLKDENIVFFGDKTLARLTKQNGYISTLTLDEVKAFSLTNNEKILTLEETLKLVNGKAPILFNIIGFELSKKFESNLLKALKEYPGEYAIMSNNPDTLIWFKDNAPEIIRGVKSGSYKAKKIGSFKTRKLKKLKFNKLFEPDFICYECKNLPNRFVNKNITLPIIAYNVKSEEEYLKLVGHSDNIVFNGFVPTI